MKIYSLLILSTLIISFSQETQSQVRPLEEILTESINNDDFIASYSSKRCAATFLEVASVLQTEYPDLTKQLIDKSSELVLVASTVDYGMSVENIDMNKVSKTQEEVHKIRKVLSDVSTNSYAKTGSYLEGHTEDLKLCRELFPLNEKIF